MPRTPTDVKKLAKEAGAKIVDLRFIDLPGMWQHFSIPVEDLEDDLFSEGIGFDGSSIRGFQQIHESDMLLHRRCRHGSDGPGSLHSHPEHHLQCIRPHHRKPYSRDPRHVAQKAEAYLKNTGIADMSYWGPEAEFYIFNDVRYDQTAHSGYYYVDSDEGIWNTGRDERPKSRLQAAPQGRLLPGAALRPVAGHPLGDHPRAARHGRARRSPSPRSRHRRPVRDRHALRPAGQDGRQSAELQVHHPHDRQEARHDALPSCPSRSLATTARGMHVHQSLWKGDTMSSSMPRATRC